MRYLIIGLFFLLTACGGEEEVKELTRVSVTPVSPMEFKPSSTYNAHLESRSEVTISALVSGELVKVHFKEGQRIKKGAPLFDIDPAPYQAAVSSAKADVTRAQANLSIAKKKLARGDELIGDNYISESEYDQLKSDVVTSQASVASAKASLAKAKVDLSYTFIMAPSDGVIGRSIANVGDIVSPDSGALTTLVGGGWMDIHFQVSEDVWFEHARHMTSESAGEALSTIEVLVEFRDGSRYEKTGRIDYVANRVNEETATVPMRAIVANPDGVLRPGQYVVARLQRIEPNKGLGIPQYAVQVDQQGTYVMVVTPQNKVERVNIELGTRVGENVVVEKGLEEQQQVIVKGLQLVKEGEEVNIQILPLSKGNNA